MCNTMVVFHLRQRRFGLGQPEGHVHGAVQGDGGGQGGAGLPPLTGRGVQGAQAKVAMGHERTYAQFLGQGLLVVGFGRRGVGGLAWLRYSAWCECLVESKDLVYGEYKTG